MFIDMYINEGVGFVVFFAEENENFKSDVM